MPNNEAAIILTDANAIMQRGIKDITGKWSVHAHTNGCGEKLKEVCTRHSLRNPTYDLVGEIRRQRFAFAGHVLRYGEERLTKQVMIGYFSRSEQQQDYPEGNILEDAPPQ